MWPMHRESFGQLARVLCHAIMHRSRLPRTPSHNALLSCTRQEWASRRKLQIPGAPTDYHDLVLQVIYIALAADFPSEPEAWDLRARRWVSQHPSSKEADAEEQAAAVYTESLEVTQGPRMFELYLGFLKERLDAWAEASGVDPQAPLLKLKGRGKATAKRILQASVHPVPLQLLT